MPSREINQVKLSLVQVSVLRDYGKLELNFAESGSNPVRATAASLHRGDPIDYNGTAEIIQCYKSSRAIKVNIHKKSYHFLSKLLMK